MAQEVRPMYRQHYLPTTGRPAGAATRRCWSRRVFAAVAAVMLGLRIDPRSASPARFDAACQSFMSALGPYLLKASDLPAGKSLAELTRDEQAALHSQPRVVISWSACTGEEPPIGRPQARPA